MFYSTQIYLVTLLSQVSFELRLAGLRENTLRNVREIDVTRKINVFMRSLSDANFDVLTSLWPVIISAGKLRIDCRTNTKCSMGKERRLPGFSLR